jgi:hypothetical protein
LSKRGHLESSIYFGNKAYFEVSNFGVIASGLIIYSEPFEDSVQSILLDFFLLFFSPASAIASKMCQKKEDLQASKLKRGAKMSGEKNDEDCF